MADEVPNQERWLGVVARALSFLCIHSTSLREADLAPKALLLESFGVPRPDIAVMLGTSEETIKVTINTAKRAKKAGKRKRSGRKK